MHLAGRCDRAELHLAGRRDGAEIGICIPVACRRSRSPSVALAFVLRKKGKRRIRRRE
jgi:hypothetical protein